MKTNASPKTLSVTFVLLLIMAGASVLALQSCGGGKPTPTENPPPPT